MPKGITWVASSINSVICPDSKQIAAFLGVPSKVDKVTACPKWNVFAEKLRGLLHLLKE